MLITVLVRTLRQAFGILAACMIAPALLPGATLEQLSLDDMIAKSTAIVRGKVASSHATAQGALIYTYYVVDVSETLKGAGANSVTVAVPGGIANNLRQTVAGAPELHAGDEFVFFLWTGKSGMTQIIGLTQGLFKFDGSQSDAVVSRAASSELMLSRITGQPVQDQGLTMKLSQLRSRIRGATK